MCRFCGGRCPPGMFNFGPYLFSGSKRPETRPLLVPLVPLVAAAWGPFPSERAAVVSTSARRKLRPVTASSSGLGLLADEGAGREVLDAGVWEGDRRRL